MMHDRAVLAALLLLFAVTPLRAQPSSTPVQTPNPMVTTTAAPTPAAAPAAAPAATGATAPAAATPAAAPPATEPSACGRQPGRPVICNLFINDRPIPPGEPADVHLGDRVAFDVLGFDEVLAKTTPENPPQLYLNTMAIPGTSLHYLPGGAESTRVWFELSRTEDANDAKGARDAKDAKDAWALLLGKPPLRRPRQVDVAIAPTRCAEGCVVAKSAVPLHLRPLRALRLAMYLLALGVLVLAVYRLGRDTSLLRDRGVTSAWSLGRCQMAWWFILVVASFLFIWMVSGSYSSLSNSVLALIGISSGTALLGAVMDGTKDRQQQERQALVNEKATLSGKVGAGSATTAEQQRLQDVDARLAQLPAVAYATTKGFWSDVLSDEHGISFHRLQIVIWTLALTTIFVARVYAKLAMPDFDDALLGLTGISSGAYLGFKFPEKTV